MCAGRWAVVICVATGGAPKTHPEGTRFLTVGKFDGILICTDLDGTLLGSDHKVSRENREAIEYFESEGGYFTFITGRPPMIVGDIYEEAKPNAPFGCLNGGGLYDGEAKRFVSFVEIDKEALVLVDDALEAIPELGVQVNTTDKIYFSKDSTAMEYFRRVTGAPNIIKDHHDIGEPITKIIFADFDTEHISRLAEFLCAHPLSEKFAFTRSESFFYEILPKGISKANALYGLSEHLGIDMKKTIALGDYDNDIEMLKAAGVGIAMKNAVPATKAAADLVSVSCDEHVIAKTVSDIENGLLFKEN